MKKLFFFALLLSQGLAAQPFEGLDDAIEQGQFGQLKSVIISRHGEIVYEGYFRGTRVNDLHQVQSVTKSIGATLVGIAHRQGKIDLKQNLGGYFSDLYDMSQPGLQNKSGITVEQILQQRHGIEWDEDRFDYRNPLNPVAQMINSDDWYRYVLERPMDSAPGTQFTYSSGASTLMSRMIRVASGMGPETFAEQELFEPLGINNVHWEIYSEEGMGQGITDWPNPDEDASLGFSLWLTARDMLKIGQLYLDRGVYQGHRILDASWIDASWTLYSNSSNSDYFPEAGWGHGYQWWGAVIPDLEDRMWPVYFASGWGSQVIFVVPDLGLVVVTTADNYDYNGPNVDALLVMIVSQLNPELDPRFNGSWYDPQTNGQGFSLEVLDPQGVVVSYWYTYTETGELRWFVLQGQVVDGVGEVTIYESSGGMFLQDDPTTLTEWGSGRFTAISCMNITLEVASTEVTTTLNLTRLTGDCETY